MGEEFILFAAVVGVVLLLRGEDKEDVEAAVGSDGVRVIGTLMVGGGILVSLWLIAFGFVTPGGGFQGGVALAGATAMLFIAAGYRSFRPFADETALDPIEGVGAGGYVVIGLAALIAGLPFLTNMIGSGKTGTLVSGGTAVFVNWAAGMEVAAANLLLFREFLEEYIVPLAGERRRS
jgi:multicomponent Na+:H+ antiporter subunit B